MTQILWSTDPATQHALLLVLGLAAVAALTIYLPLAFRAARLWLLERRLRRLVGAAPGGADAQSKDELRERLLASPIASAYREFERRWSMAQLSESAGRAPIRLIDILDEQPLLPFGPRRTLLPILPGLFLAMGVFAALTGLIPSLGVFGDSAIADEARSAWMADQLGLALRASAWGFLCAIAASLSGRLIEGALEARSHGLDRVVESAFGSVSPGELAEFTRQTQQRSLETLGRELTDFSGELSQRLDRGLQRIEQSTARSANLVSQEQRGALHTVVQELSLSIRQGVEHHLTELRNALQRAVEHQAAVTNGLAETFQRMVENAQTQDRVARTLSDSAGAVEEAARSMRASSAEMQPVLEQLGSTSRALAETADRITSTQQVVARTAEGVRSSLEHAATGVEDQRQFLEMSLTEIRRTVAGLGDGLGENLQRALREVDDVLGVTVGQLRDTLAESNETIDRLAGPIRAAEGSTRETHLALDRVRSEVEALGQWMSQAVKPLRTGLGDIEGRAEEIARAMVEFTNHTRQIDKTMEALRLEIHEESRRLQGTGSELSRRLTLAGDVVGLLENTTSEAARHPRTESTQGSARRERPWSSSSLGRDSGREPVFSPTRYDPASTSPRSLPPASPRARDGAIEPGDSTAGRKVSEPTTADSDEAASAPESGPLPLSGYRLGTPRAKGPDPYARFDEESSSPSKIRPFPTQEHDPREGLKLSGLLGPSDRNAAPSSPTAASAAPGGSGSEPEPDSEPGDTSPRVEPARSAADEQD
jgi:methyl-accepting chemotaxis protein